MARTGRRGSRARGSGGRGASPDGLGPGATGVHGVPPCGSRLRAIDSGGPLSSALRTLLSSGMRTVRGRGLRRLGIAAMGTAAAVLYSNFLLDVAAPGAHDWSVVVSELEIPGRPASVFLRTTDIAAAVLTLGLLPSLARRFPASALRTVLLGGVAAFAAGEILAAIITLPPEGTDAPALALTSDPDTLRAFAHNAVSILSVGGMLASAASAGLMLRGLPDQRGVPHQRGLPDQRPAWLHAGLGIMAVGCVVSLTGEAVTAVEPAWGLAAGLGQRVQICSLSAWILYLTGLALGARSALPAAAQPASAASSASSRSDKGAVRALAPRRAPASAESARP